MRKGKKISDYQNIIITSLLIVVLFSMTVGFALYNQLLNITGQIVLKPDGLFEVTRYYTSW